MGLSGELSSDLHAYLVSHGTPPDRVLADLAEETVRVAGERAEMRIAPEQGALLDLLARLLHVRFAVEVGTFTGYSSICLARGVGAGGRLVCCDIDETWTAVAQRYWMRAEVADRVELRIGRALDTLRRLPEDASIDLAFLDADKPGYVDYWEELVPRVRSGGLLIADNVLFHGQVTDSEASGNAAAIQRFNEHVLADNRVEQVILPVGDGLTIARRR